MPFEFTGQALVESFDTNLLDVPSANRMATFALLPSRERLQKIVGIALNNVLNCKECLDRDVLKRQVTHLYDRDPDDYTQEDRRALGEERPAHPVALVLRAGPGERPDRRGVVAAPRAQDGVPLHLRLGLPAPERQVVADEEQLDNGIAKDAGPSVVSIDVTSRATGGGGNDLFERYFGGGGGQSQDRQSAGTGIILSDDGVILTNRHVIPSGTSSVSCATS